MSPSPGAGGSTPRNAPREADDRDVVAIIPARGGSKGIPRKNLRLLGGRPLIAWSIDAALGSRRVAEVLVTSDDPEILAVAEGLGARAVPRPAELATDDAPTEPALVHALDVTGVARPLTLLLQPTSPLRDHHDVDAALAHLDATGADALISVVEPTHAPWKAFYVTPEGTLRGIVSDEAPFRPRQSFPRAAHPDGAIYVCRTALLQSTGRLFGARTVPWFTPPAHALDIDTEEDLAEAARRLALRRPG